MLPGRRILELQEIIIHHQNWIDKNPLIKNFRIGGVEHILYTIPLGAGAGIVGIFFDPSIKFSQTSYMAKKYAARVLQEQNNIKIPGESINDPHLPSGISTVNQHIFIPGTKEFPWDADQ